MAEALVATALGTALVDLAAGTVELVDDEPPAPRPVEVGLPLVVAADAVGSRVVAVVERRPPLLISDDVGTTWREAGGGLPAGVAVAIDPLDVDRILYASSSRLFLSSDGGRFWHGLPIELHEVRAVAWHTSPDAG